MNVQDANIKARKMPSAGAAAPCPGYLVCPGCGGCASSTGLARRHTRHHARPSDHDHQLPALIPALRRPLHAHPMRMNPVFLDSLMRESARGIEPGAKICLVFFWFCFVLLFAVVCGF